MSSSSPLTPRPLTSISAWFSLSSSSVCIVAILASPENSGFQSSVGCHGVGPSTSLSGLCRSSSIGRRCEVFDNVPARSNQDWRIDLFVDTSQRAAHLMSGTGIRATREAVWRSSSFVFEAVGLLYGESSRRLSVVDTGVEPQRSLRLPLRTSPAILLV
jgi:hypothetical protein